MDKKIYFRRFSSIVIATLMVCGCSDTITTGEINEKDDAMLMQFGTVRVGTRAIVNSNILQQAGSTFSVWGTYYKKDTAPISLFNGTIVTSDGAKWTYDELQYWIPTFTYNFRALYPNNLTGVSFQSTNPNDTYLTVDNFDVTQDIDLLAAYPEAIACNGQKMAPVALNFNHLLSQVVFVGRSDEKYLGTGRRIIIDTAKLYGIHTTGKWSGQNATATSPGSWTPTGEPLDKESTNYSATSVELQTDGTSLFTGEGTLFFLPQSLENAVLEITYHYNYTNADEPLQFTGIVHLHELTKKWEPGKSYRYPFTVSNHIFFQTPTVEEWKQAPVNGSDFNVDIDEENP